MAHDIYRGLVFDLRLHRLLVQRLKPSHALAFAMKSLQLREMPYPRVSHDPQWTAIKPLLAGICGSDLGLLKGASSPYLAPLVSLPAVLGHEVVGQIDSPGTPWPIGTRVVVDPTLACAARGLPLCDACQRGEPDGCGSRSDPGLGPGLLLGYHHSLPGGWSSRMWVPTNQLIPVPDHLDNRRAVLAEPASIVFEGLSRLDWDRIATVLIIGAGPIGLLTTGLAGTQHPRLSLYIRARHRTQARLATEAGATHVFLESRNDNFVTSPELDDIAGRLLPRSYGGWPFRTGGFDAVIDTVGNQSSLFQAFTLTRPGGQILLLGGAGRLAVDFAPLWSRRITLAGSYGYGHPPHASAGGTFADVLQWLANTSTPIEHIVSHTVPLSRFADAFDLLQSRRSGVVKVAFHNDVAASS